jgi:hypothetical protein
VRKILDTTNLRSYALATREYQTSGEVARELWHMAKEYQAEAGKLGVSFQ